MNPRIYLSPPHLSGLEAGLVSQALASNWVAPLGPHVDAFEKEIAARVGTAHAAALSSGTAALHLAVLLSGVQPGDEVLCSTLTFSASANAIIYAGGRPVFIDAEPQSWTIDPHLVMEAIQSRVRLNRPPKALIAVDLYGQCADYDSLYAICRDHGIVLIEDAAEALGATYRGRPAGSFGAMAIFSFNGNKIITTSGGGMLVSDNETLIQKARFLATQARDPAPHYQHSEIGFNYRMSNVLAAIGRGQLAVLDERVAKRRNNFNLYKKVLEDLPGLSFMPEASCGQTTRWLTCILVNPNSFGATREDVRLALEGANIEARPLWKPMHLQPVFRECSVTGGRVSEKLFDEGLCLPSGTALSEADILRIASIIRSCAKSG